MIKFYSLGDRILWFGRSSFIVWAIEFHSLGDRDLGGGGISTYYLTGGGISTYYLTGTCHFAQKIGTHNSVNSGGFRVIIP